MEDKKPINAAYYSDLYLKWVKENNVSNLTNTQHRFAEWLLEEENAKIVQQIGNLDPIFLSIRKFLKS